MKRFVLMLVLAVVAFVGEARAQAPLNVIPEVAGTVSLRRNWGAVTGSVDSTTFLLKRGTSDGTASGLRDTLAYIDVSLFDRSLAFNNGAAKTALGWLVVTFNNAGAAGSSGDSLGVEWQGSIDGTNWTGLRTIEWYVQTAGTAVAALPIWYDTDGQVSMATTDASGWKYLRALLAGDSAGKQVISSVQIVRQKRVLLQ